MSTSLKGIDDGTGYGVNGVATNGVGVKGVAAGGDGVVGTTHGIHKAGIRGIHTGHISAIAVIGELQQGTAAVYGITGGGSGVAGDEVIGSGAWGDSSKGPGISGTSSVAQGVIGVSGNVEGVLGISHAMRGGVVGMNDSPSGSAGQGVYGESTKGEGIRGVSHSAHGGVVGVNDSSASDAGQGVYGESTNGEGVRGVSGSATHGGVVGISTHSAGIGVYGQGGRLAAQFQGNVEVTGDIQFIGGGDCAEDFAIAPQQTAAPGAVMVLDEEGLLQESSQPYDKRVVGVISGAGNYKPGIVLDRHPLDKPAARIALMGKVFCKVDAKFGRIDIGDLLTTSSTPGHAMKAGDPGKAFGAVIGKALDRLEAGRSLIPVLVARQ